MDLTVNIKIDVPEALPVYAHVGDGGADLRTMVGVDIPPGGIIKVPTGVSVEIPYGFAGLAMSRSGHGKLKVRLANCVGLIDHAYRDQIYLMLENDGSDPYKAEKFDRVGQLVIVPVAQCTFNVVSELSRTTRGEGGFGSSSTS